jgi:DNA polymerase III delta prime subunit
MEFILHERLIGQEHAVVAVSKAIRRARVGLRNPNRPIASFIFAGPTGVGKTELTKALSDYMFGSEESMIRLDMSEYMEKHTVAKLIGSPPGYVGYNEGGQLTEAVRSKPYSVVLFDEVEKAHPDVFNLLLQILDDGRLTDSKGRLIDFTNTLIVMTTNLGAKIIERESGIQPKKPQQSGLKLTVNDPLLGWEPAPEAAKDEKLIERVRNLVNDELKNFFRPEFLNRIDEIIVFNHLTKRDIWEIASLMIKQLVERLQDKEIILSVHESVQALLADEGYDPLYGARPLRRAIMHFLEDPLAERCLSETLYPNTKIIVERESLEMYKLKKRLEKNKNDDTKRFSNIEEINLFDNLQDELNYSEFFKESSIITGIRDESGVDINSIDIDDVNTFTNNILIDLNFEMVDPKFKRKDENKEEIKNDDEVKLKRRSLDDIDLLKFDQDELTNISSNSDIKNIEMQENVSNYNSDNDNNSTINTKNQKSNENNSILEKSQEPKVNRKKVFNLIKNVIKKLLESIKNLKRKFNN